MVQMWRYESSVSRLPAQKFDKRCHFRTGGSLLEKHRVKANCCHVTEINHFCLSFRPGNRIFTRFLVARTQLSFAQNPFVKDSNRHVPISDHCEDIVLSFSNADEFQC
jgi:hypothetical protein